MTSALSSLSPNVVSDTALGSTLKSSKRCLGQIARRAAAKEEAAYDVILIQRFVAGDESAFVEITNRHREKIFSVALRWLRNRADAEEIVQDTFIRAYRGLARFRGDSSLYTWLHHIVVNMSRNRYWYFFRRRRHLTLSLDCSLKKDSASTFADVVASGAASPVREATANEFSSLIATCMDKLDARHREILTLCNTLDCSYDEIAQMLGINIGTVKSRISRARGNLRLLLNAECPEFAQDAAAVDWFEMERAAPRSAVHRPG